MLAQADIWILNEFNLLYYERMWTAILVAAWGQDCHECDRFPALLQLRGVGDSTGESMALLPTVKLISQPSVDGPGETVRKNVEQILEEEMQRTRDLIREAAAQPSNQTAIVLQAPAADADNAADEAATGGAALFAQSPAPDQAALVAQAPASNGTATAGGADPDADPAGNAIATPDQAPAPAPAPALASAGAEAANGTAADAEGAAAAGTPAEGDGSAAVAEANGTAADAEG